jgi:hypothetical protein
MEQRFKLGTLFKTRGKHPRLCIEHPANYAGLQDHVTKLIQRARGES